MISRARPRRSTAAATASILALGGGLSIAAALPAAAADDIKPNIYWQLGGSIVVTKYQNPTANPLPAGTGMQTTPSGTPLPGVRFELCPVIGRNMSPGTNVLFPTIAQPGGTSRASRVSDSEWWAFAAQINDDFAHGITPWLSPDAPAGMESDCFTGVTDANGQIVFGDGQTGTEGTGSSAWTWNHGGYSMGLELGLYLVREISGGTDSIVVPSEPYLVTLPFAGPESCSLAGSAYATQASCEAASGTWAKHWITRQQIDPPIDPGRGEYIVWTYPKNATVSVEKTADTDETYSYGTLIGYQIVTPIPNKTGPASCSVAGVSVADCTSEGGSVIPGRPNLSSLVLTDTLSVGLDFELTDPDGTGTSGFHPVVTIGPDATHPSAQTLVEGTDYIVSVSGQTATITFTSYSGIDVVNSYAVGTPITVTFNAEFLGVTSTENNVVRNTAQVTWDSASAQDDVETKVGGIQIHKQNSVTGGALSGATFQIYGEDPATGASNIWALDATNTPAQSFTDDASETGVITINGLRYYTDSDPNSPAPTCYMTMDMSGPSGTTYSPTFGTVAGRCSDSSIPSRAQCLAAGATWTWLDASGNALDPYGTVLGTTYWVVETVAPPGYLLDSTPHPVCVFTPSHSRPAGDDWYIDNQPTDIGVELPFTGQTWKYLPVAVGVVFMAGVCTLYVIRSKKVNAPRTIA